LRKSPVRDSQQETATGALSIYSRNTDAFNKEETQVLEELATDVGIGIKTFREVEARKQAEQRVRQAEKMDAIGTLAGGIAHDFNNILSPILGFTQMVMEDLPQGRKQVELTALIFPQEASLL